MSASVIHREEIIRRRKAGEWPRAIARALGVTHNVVIGVCNRAGLTDKDAGRFMVPRGELVGTAKLTVDQVKAIRREHGANFPNVSQQSIAARYGVSQTTVSAIFCGKTWAHLDDEAA